MKTLSHMEKGSLEKIWLPFPVLFMSALKIKSTTYPLQSMEIDLFSRTKYPVLLKQWFVLCGL